MYGYDLYDFLQIGPLGLVCLCMIMDADNQSTGYVLYKIGRTRCNRLRNDGLLYHVRQDK